MDLIEQREFLQFHKRLTRLHKGFKDWTTYLKLVVGNAWRRFQNIFFNWAYPGLFFVYFRLFKHKLQFLQKINVKISIQYTVPGLIFYHRHLA